MTTTTTKIKYEWAEGGPPPPVDPAIAATELARIEKRDGGIQAEVVVAEAAKPGSPLHAAFEWDDSKAAHEYRLEQARNIIRKVRVVVDSEPPKRVFVHVKTADFSGYEPLEKAVGDMHHRLALLSSCRTMLQSALARYREVLAESGASGQSVIDAVENFLSENA